MRSPARETTTTSAIVEMLCKKRNIPLRDVEDYSLFISDTNSDRTPLRSPRPLSCSNWYACVGFVLHRIV